VTRQSQQQLSAFGEMQFKEHHTNTFILRCTHTNKDSQAHSLTPTHITKHDGSNYCYLEKCPKRTCLHLAWEILNTLGNIQKLLLF